MSIPVPRIDRSLKLEFRGDWGRANMHRILGWLCGELVHLSGSQTRIAIWNGWGGLDNIQAVGRGEVDLSLVTPSAFTAMAYQGRGPCVSEPFPNLRAIGHVPQNDRMVFAVRGEFDIRSFADLRAKQPKLRITAGRDDGASFMGMAAQHLLKAGGAPRAAIESWGGRFIEHETPFECVDDMLSGQADAIIQEAVLTRQWAAMADRLDLTYVPIDPAARDALLRDFGWPSATLPKNYLRGMTSETEFLDFSHFLLITTDRLPEDVAYALAWALVERWKNLEDQYRHIPPEHSPISYPLDAQAACRTPIPLHAGAERYFSDAGHLK
jgi:uncharacterized protein